MQHVNLFIYKVRDKTCLETSVVFECFLSAKYNPRKLFEFWITAKLNPREN